MVDLCLVGCGVVLVVICGLAGGSCFVAGGGEGEDCSGYE